MVETKSAENISQAELEHRGGSVAGLDPGKALWEVSGSLLENCGPFYLVVSVDEVYLQNPLAYLIFVIFFTLAKFLENKIYTEKRQFFALNL